jgi:hypothetical protein
VAYTSPSTRAAGYVVGSTQWNELVNNDKWLAADGASGKPICRATRSLVQGIPNNVSTAVSWSVNSVDNAGSHSTTVNPSRFIAPVAGWYRLFASITWQVNSTSQRIASIVPNGSGTADNTSTAIPVSAVNTSHAVESILHLSAGQYAEVFVLQGAGGTLNIETLTFAWFEWLAVY